VAKLAMKNFRRLVEAAAGFHPYLADAFVLEQHPALQHVDELHLAIVRMPLAMRRLARPRADYVRDDCAARRALDAEVAVFEITTQAAARELRLLAMGDAEAHRAGILR